MTYFYYQTNRYGQQNHNQEQLEELKKQYTIADTVLRNGNTLYICYEVIEAEFEDIP